MAIPLQRRQIFAVDTDGNTVPLLANSDGTLKVDTELTLSADNVTIGNVKVFSDSSGTQYFGLVDSSRRIILSPSSTITASQSGTWDINVASSSIMLPVDLQARYFTSTQVFSSTVVPASGTATSSWIDISKYPTKTISLLSSSASGTLIIQVAPSSSTATAYDYYTDSSVSSNTFTAKSFSEAFNWVRIQFIPSASSTIDAWISMMA